MKKLLGILVLGLLLSGNAYAAYTGLALTSCGEILSRENETLTKESVIFYISGHITGRNYANSGSVGKNLEKDASYDSLYWAAIKYCKENPLKDTSDAAKYVYQLLKN